LFIIQFATLLFVMSFIEQFIAAFWVCKIDRFIPEGFRVLFMKPLENGVGPVEFKLLIAL
jgi:hypothetical protein